MANFLIWWALPSMCVLFLYIQMTKSEEHKTVSRFDTVDWISILFYSTFWPVGLGVAVLVFIGHVFKASCKFLTKDRKWL